LAATGNAVVENQSIKYSGKENTTKWVKTILITMTVDNAGRLRPIR